MILKLLFLVILMVFPAAISAQLQMSPQFRCTITHFPPPGEINCVSIPFPQRVFPASRLNERAASLPQPVYPPAAIVQRARGTVSVQVLIDEEGNVLSASAVAGHPLLRASAVQAARKAKFSPAIRSGQPVKVSGILVYRFTIPPRAKLAAPDNR
jgi:protein TonB